MAVGTFMALLPFALQSNDHDSYYLQAVAVGQQFLDAERASVENNKPLPSATSIPIDGGGSVVGPGMRNSPGNFTIFGTCTAPVPPSNLRQCTAEVDWTERQQTRSYTISSFAIQQVS